MVLPNIMIAPNGARKMKYDHPAIPISISEIVDTAISCRDLGADGLHAHVRVGNGTLSDAPHTLDAGLYTELLRECDTKLPDFYVQITTEAVGRYSPEEMDAVVREVRPRAVSVGLKEMGGGVLARDLYHWARDENIEVQHILYSADDVEMLAQYFREGFVPDGKFCCLFVLGRYSENLQSGVADLMPFIDVMKQNFINGENWPDWAVCAFGAVETECLAAANKMGGKMRIGFENNMINRDGSLAKDNAERVRKIVATIAEHDLGS